MVDQLVIYTDGCTGDTALREDKDAEEDEIEDAIDPNGKRFLQQH